MRAILILGAAVWADGPSPTLRRRTTHALTLWREDPQQLIIPCGGLGVHPPTEAEAMAAMLELSGVPKRQILLEDQSCNTLENIAFAIKLMPPQIERVVIVSDRYHLVRACMTARSFGLSAELSAPPLKGASMSTNIRQSIRELFAIPVYALKLWRYHKGH